MQARDQPLRREGDADSQLDLHLALLAHEFERVAADLVEMDANPPRIFRACRGQYQPLAYPLEQCDAPMGFEFVDLFANSTMRLRQFDSSFRKTSMARRRFESLQRTETGNTAAHR